MSRIMIVDDDANFRQMVRNALEPEGQEVVEATNGVEALHVYRNRPADLILLDLLMPEKDGLETIQELKKEFPEVKIFAISGGGGLDPDPTSNLVAAKHLGAIRTFIKPVDMEELTIGVRHVLHRDGGN